MTTTYIENLSLSKLKCHDQPQHNKMSWRKRSSSSIHYFMEVTDVAPACKFVNIFSEKENLIPGYF